MKTAIYIEEGKFQLVLTPENDWEKEAVSKIGSGAEAVSIGRGSFYKCVAGYYRHGVDDDSLIFRISKPVHDA